MFQDELLFYAYLELAECSNLDDATTQQPYEQLQMLQQPITSSSSRGTLGFKGAAQQNPRRYRPSTGSVTEGSEEGQEEEGDGFSAVDEDISSQTSQATAAVSAAAAAAAAVGGTAQQHSASHTSVARVSDVTTQSLALLSAAKNSGGSSSSSSSRAGSFRATVSGLVGGSSGGKLRQLRLKRSTHVRGADNLVVSVWWVLQPAVVDTGVSRIGSRGCAFGCAFVGGVLGGGGVMGVKGGVGGAEK